jgi:hypothetical protein
MLIGAGAVVEAVRLSTLGQMDRQMVKAEMVNLESLRNSPISSRVATPASTPGVLA